MMIQTKERVFTTKEFKVEEGLHITVKEVNRDPLRTYDKKEDQKNNSKIYKEINSKYKDIKSIKTCKSITGKELIIVII